MCGHVTKSPHILFSIVILFRLTELEKTPGRSFRFNVRLVACRQPSQLDWHEVVRGLREFDIPWKSEVCIDSGSLSVFYRHMHPTATEARSLHFHSPSSGAPRLESFLALLSLELAYVR